MKLYLLQILITLSLLSCGNQTKKEFVQEFLLYGHGGFCFIDSTNYIFDSTSFDIREYFEFKKDSSIKIAVRHYKKKIEFLKITPIDTNGLSDILNNLFLLNISDTDYYPTEQSMYEGFWYTMHLKSLSGKSFSINYIPNYLPKELRIVHEFIIKIIYSRNNEQTTGFQFNKMLTSDALLAF